MSTCDGATRLCTCSTCEHLGTGGWWRVWLWLWPRGKGRRKKKPESDAHRTSVCRRQRPQKNARLLCVSFRFLFSCFLGGQKNTKGATPPALPSFFCSFVVVRFGGSRGGETGQGGPGNRTAMALHPPTCLCFCGTRGPRILRLKEAPHFALTHPPHLPSENRKRRMRRGPETWTWGSDGANGNLRNSAAYVQHLRRLDTGGWWRVWLWLWPRGVAKKNRTGRTTSYLICQNVSIDRIDHILRPWRDTMRRR
jgi:hypothetical protein